MILLSDIKDKMGTHMVTDDDKQCSISTDIW